MEILALMGFIFSGSATLVVLQQAYKEELPMALFNISFALITSWQAAYALDSYIKG